MKKRQLPVAFAISCCMLFFGLNASFAQRSTTQYANLQKDQVLNGFKTVSVYLNDADKPMGARFIHLATGFTLDLLQIESVPQCFIWVNTFPVSDKGEPHTQEHLLITKGNKGHELNTREGMSLTESNAYTSQLHTVYNFNTGAGTGVFYTLFEKYLDALLYPDYSDEEVSREVRNWGIAQNADKTLRLEEKGSVYNEMSSSMNNPYAIMYDSIARLVYGNGHPLSFNAGGSPEGIRVLNAGAIAQFHMNNYYPGNMGAIISLPKQELPGNILDRVNKILLQLVGNSVHNTAPANKLPPAKPAVPGSIALLDVPTENAQEPGNILMEYPATLNLNSTESILLTNFLSVFAGDASTNLYKIFVDSKTKQPGMDAQAVYAYLDEHEGRPVFIGLDGIDAGNLNLEKAILARQRVMDELKQIAAYKDHSPELIAFNKRYENSLKGFTRYESKFVNSPPKFGFRNTGDAWYSQLQELNKLASFQKSVVFKPQLEEIKKLLATGTNIWKVYLEKWNLVAATPYVVMTKANTSLLAKADAAKKERAAAELARLKATWHVDDDQAAILRYKALYDSNTAVLEKMEQAHVVRFIDNPPLTPDDQLIYENGQFPGHPAVMLTASSFNNMSGASTGIALTLREVPADKLLYLALLPELITQTGIIKNNKVVSYEDMTQQLQQEILGLESYFSVNEKTGRAELVVKAAGNNPAEAKRAVEWISDVLQQPNWTKENLPRISDLIDQQLTQNRKTMQEAEEEWVRDPGRAWRAQNNPLLLATSSFLTKSHNLFRLKWMLKDAGDADNKIAIRGFLASLYEAETGREQIKKLLAVLVAEQVIADSAGADKQYVKLFNQLPPVAKSLAKEAARDLEQILNDIPDESLSEDWRYLCMTIRECIAQTPEKTLAGINALRKQLLNQAGTRIFITSSDNTRRQLIPGIHQLLTGFADHPLQLRSLSTEKMVARRVKERLHQPETPVLAGLINPNSQTGVFINSAPLITYKDTGREQLLRFLAAELYGGAGKQSVYTKTTGAGLSYSTGTGISAATGLFNYYAERTPELPQTLKFVIDELKRSPLDTTMLDYVVSLAVGSFRAAGDYEIRTESMAADLADHIMPEEVKQFRRAVLKLRKEPGLIYDIYKYKDEVYEKILPGYGINPKEVKGGNYFVIGPEKQMKAYETYLKAIYGAETKLVRLYPRDFWMP